MRELAERRVAQLNGRIQGLESRLHQLAEENRALASRAPAAQAGVTPQVDPLTHPFGSWDDKMIGLHIHAVDLWGRCP